MFDVYDCSICNLSPLIAPLPDSLYKESNSETGASPKKLTLEACTRTGSKSNRYCATGSAYANFCYFFIKIATNSSHDIKKSVSWRCIQSHFVFIIEMNLNANLRPITTQNSLPRKTKRLKTYHHLSVTCI